MAAILLRAAWLDALDIDAKPQPPYGGFREIEQSMGEAKDKPLSERMALGKPRSSN